MARKLRHFLVISFTSLTISACGGGSSTGSTGSAIANNIGVGGAATGTATVFWTAPISTESGAALSISQLGGYQINYGTSPTNLAYSVNVPDPYATQYVMAGLHANTTYYFAVTAYDSQNVVGAMSAVVSKRIS